MPFTFKGQPNEKNADQYRKEFVELSIPYFNPNDMDVEEGMPFLHSAVKHNLLEGVKALVSYPETNINLCYRSLTVLHIACGLKNLLIIQQLLLKTASLEYQNGDKKTPFDLLSTTEDKELLENLLFFAIAHDMLIVIQELKKRGINLNCVNKEGQTLLHIICKQRKVPIIKWMISEDIANFDIKNRENQTPLQLLTVEEEKDRIFLEYLLTEACAKDRRTLVNRLLELRVNPNCADSFGRTPLHLAARAGSVNVVSQLLDIAAVDFYKKTNLNNSVLHTAAFNNRPEIVKLLIKKDSEIADIVNKYIDNNDILNDNIAVAGLLAQNYFASRLLEMALNEYRRQANNSEPINKESLKLCVLKGMLINSLNDDGQTPLMYALEQSEPDHVKLSDIVELFFSEKYFNAKDEILNRRAKNKDHYIHLLIKNPIQSNIINKFIFFINQNTSIINEVNDAGMTALHLSLQHRDMIPVLLRHGAKPEIPNNDGMTFLHLIAKENNFGALSDFIKCLDTTSVKQEMTKLIKIKNAEGKNVIHIAAENSDPALLILLLDNLEESEKKAIINGKDSKRRPDAFRSEGEDTPLHLALKNGKYKNYLHLIEHGADSEQTNAAYQKVSALVKVRQIAQAIAAAKEEIAKNKNQTVTKPRASSVTQPPSLNVTAFSQGRVSTGGFVVPEIKQFNDNEVTSSDTPSSGRSHVSTQELIEQQQDDLVYRNKTNVFDKLDNLFKPFTSWISKTAIGQHLSKHQKKYIAGILAFYYISFGAVCILSIFFPPVATTIPIYIGVGKALGALHLAANVIPVVAKVITFLLPVIAPHILGVGATIMAAVAVRAYKLFGELIPSLFSTIYSNVSNWFSTNSTKKTSSTYNAVSQKQDDEFSTSNSCGDLSLENTQGRDDFNSSLSDSTSCLGGWVKSLSENIGQPFCAFFSSISDIFDGEANPKEQQNDTPNKDASKKPAI